MSVRSRVSAYPFTQPRNPYTPEILPRMTKSSVPSCPEACSERSRRAGVFDFKAESSGSGFFLHQKLKEIRSLGALAQPVVVALHVQTQGLFLFLGAGIVKADTLDAIAAAGTATIGDDDFVEGTLLGAATGKANGNHVNSSCRCSGAKESGGRRKAGHSNGKSGGRKGNITIF